MVWKFLYLSPHLSHPVVALTTVCITFSLDHTCTSLVMLLSCYHFLLRLPKDLIPLKKFKVVQLINILILLWVFPLNYRKKM